jgi:hypothetical protein
MFPSVASGEVLALRRGATKPQVKPLIGVFDPYRDRQPAGRDSDSITTLRRPASPAFAVDDLVERTPTRMRDRQEGTVSRVSERHEPDAEAILGGAEDLARQRLVVNSRV